MTDLEISTGFRTNSRLAVLASHVIVALMLACAVFSIVELGEYLIPDWSGDYLVWVAFFLALEGMVSWRILEKFPSLSVEWLVHRFTEWVVILFGLKILLYAPHGFDRLLSDLPLWQQNFIESFFTGEYLFAIGIVILVWVIAGMFAGELRQLEGDERQLSLESESRLFVERQAVRSRIANLTISIGLSLIFLVAFMRLDWEALWGGRPPITAGVTNVMLYFVLGLILFSLTQFSLLRVHWVLEKVPIRHDVAGRWFIYSSLFLLTLAIVSLLLPTHYAIGFLTVLSFIISTVGRLVGLLLILLLTPIFLLITLIGWLMGQPVNVPPIEFEKLIPPPTAAAAPPADWAEMVKSVLFWLIFVGIIGYSIFHYVKQHKELTQTLGKFGLWRSLLNALRSLRGWLRGVNHNLAQAVESGWRRLRTRAAVQDLTQGWRFTSLRRMSARQRVLFYYLAMVRRVGERGFPRSPAQTPYEYSQALRHRLPEVDVDVTSLTEQFVEARYSRHEITPDRAGLVKRYWDHIKQALRRMVSQ